MSLTGGTGEPAPFDAGTICLSRRVPRSPSGCRRALGLAAKQPSPSPFLTAWWFVEENAVEPSDPESHDEAPLVDHPLEGGRLVDLAPYRLGHGEQLLTYLIAWRGRDVGGVRVTLRDRERPEMWARDVQGGMWITPQDPALHAIGGRRDARHLLRRIPNVQDVREVRIAAACHRRENSLMAGRDYVKQLLFIRHLDSHKDAGVVRADIELFDLPLIQLAIGTIAESSRDVAPDVWRRTMTLVLDGLQPRTPPASSPCRRRTATPRCRLKQKNGVGPRRECGAPAATLQSPRGGPDVTHGGNS